MYIESNASTGFKICNGSLAKLGDLKENNIVLNSLSKECYWPEHSDNLSLKFAFTGQEFYALNKRKFGVSRDNFLVVNKNEIHSSWIRSDIWVNSFAIYLNTNFVNAVLSSLLTPDDFLLENPSHTIQDEFCFPQQLYSFSGSFKEMVVRFKQKLETTELTTDCRDSSLQDILTSLVTLYRTDVIERIYKLPVAKKSTKIEIHRRLQIARDYLDTNFTERVTIQQLAKETAMAENHLLKHFKQHYAITPHQYMINKRMNLAQEYLSESNLSVSEIVQKLGFEDASSFCRLFKSKFNHTPLEWRKGRRVEV